MPILQQAKKALRSSSKKRVFNDRRRRTLKDNMKAVKKLITAENKAEAQKMMPVVQKSIDKAVQTGVLKKNTAARKKTRLIKAIQKIA